MREPVTTLDARYSEASAVPTPWAETRAVLQGAELAWLVSLRPDGSPHATPVVPIWADEGLHFTTGDREQKARNLRHDGRVLLQVGRLDWQHGLDVVVEGRATLTTDPVVLARLAAVWHERWDGRWRFDARGDHLEHPEGFAVLTYSVQPRQVRAFAQGRFGATLHHFD